MFLGGFYTSSVNGKRNECSAEELQNLQLYLSCVSTLPDKNFKHIKPLKRHILKSIATVFYYSTLGIF